MRSGGSAIGVTLRSTTQWENEWRRYGELTSFKALAVAGDLNGVYVSGFAHAYPLQSLANDEALDACEERRVDRRVEGPCHLYAIGDDRVRASSIKRDGRLRHATRAASP
jgi:hypothetical protein